MNQTLRAAWVVFFCGPFTAFASASRLSPAQIESARAGALRIMVKAQANDLAATYAVLVSDLRAKLLGASLFAPDPGMNFVNCGPNTLAFTEIQQDAKSIWLCALSLEGSVDKLEQTLVHEAGHLIGNEDECAASRIELTVMKLSGTPLQYENMYLKSCGLTP